MQELWRLVGEIQDDLRDWCDHGEDFLDRATDKQLELGRELWRISFSLRDGGERGSRCSTGNSLELQSLEHWSKRLRREIRAARADDA